ncbi:hypothetical protein Gotur_020026, partial [Gossypium turneri]
IPFPTYSRATVITALFHRLVHRLLIREFCYYTLIPSAAVIGIQGFQFVIAIHHFSLHSTEKQ